MTEQTTNAVAHMAPENIAAPKAYDELTKEEFDAAMSVGLAQARAGQSAPVDEVFDRLIGALANG